MTLRQHFANAITDLSRNKLRTGLSMLGIIIWVFSVIVMLSVWNWATEEIVWQVNSMWTNMITITPGWSIFSIGQGGSRWDVATINDKTINFLNTNVSNIDMIAPVVQWSKQVIYWDTNTRATIVWTTPNYANIRSLDFVWGRFLSEDEESNMKKVAVLWNKIATDLFGNENPIWKSIKLENISLQIIWVLDEDAMADSYIFVPISTAKIRILWTKDYHSIFLSTIDSKLIDSTKNDIENSLRNFYGIKEWKSNNFSVTTQKEILEIVDQIMWIMSTFLAAIAAISLLVWWIWVMNIMLVSVTERTKEIWIRKAIGAKKSDIVSQFLAESVLMTVFWWIIWILLSILAVRIINHVQDTIHAVISLKSVLIAVISSVSIGLIFWIMPARNAAKLKPIDALRFE